MTNLKFLELQRLIKELQFVESDYIYQSEIIKQSDDKFLENVDFILNRFPNLKVIWDEKQDQKYEFTNQNSNNNDIDENELKDSKFKKAYREIVKNTHPDKVKNSKLNDTYLEATSAYESGDFVTLYKICTDLNITIDLTDDEIDKIKSKINIFKNRIKFLESTYTYRWLKSSDLEDKNKVILSFIENKIK